MRDGFIKVAAGTPRIRVAGREYNPGQNIGGVGGGAKKGGKGPAPPRRWGTRLL